MDVGVDRRLCGTDSRERVSANESTTLSSWNQNMNLSVLLMIIVLRDGLAVHN
jgi:hypothetical protein